jgi:hypothetical protein
MPKTQRSPISSKQCSSETDIPSIAHDDVARENVGRRQKRKALASPVTADTDLIRDKTQLSILSEFRQEFTECLSEMREFRKEMAQLRESFAAVVSRLDSVELRVTELEQRGPSMEPDRVSELERTITELRLELNDRDQEALLSDIEIGLLPEDKGENVIHAVTVLAARLGVTLEARDVVFAERVGAPQDVGGAGRPRRVVVRLARHHLRDELLRAARVRRLGADAGGGRLYLNERLTRPNRQLFRLAREECRKHKWRYSWTKRGRIFVREENGKPAFQLRSTNDFLRVFGLQAV